MRYMVPDRIRLLSSSWVAGSPRCSEGQEKREKEEGETEIKGEKERERERADL